MTHRLTLRTRHGEVPLPTYLPDATRGVVRCVDAGDLESVGLDMIMVNAFHLGTRPGVSRIERLGGINRFMGWQGPIASDSGGFQALSLIRENAKHGTVREDGLLLRLPERDKVHLTPDKAIRHQLKLGSDVVISLDVCTMASDDHDVQARSVDRTIAWARAGREVFERHTAKRDGPRPLLVGVVQGGLDTELRTRCAQALVELGFDAYGFGGWPIDEQGRLHIEMFELLESLLPADKPRFALGVGRPEHLVALVRRNPNYVFDCSLPTRDARRQRLYRFTSESGALAGDGGFYKMVHVLDERHASSTQPIDDSCDGPCCRRYALSYHHHLAKIGDAAGLRLATMHNLRFYVRLIARLRAERLDDPS